MNFKNKISSILLLQHMININKFEDQSESGLVFKVFLPENIEPHILDWFKFQECQDHLSIELIKLIQDHLNSIEQIKLSCEPHKPAINSTPDDFFSNLYNWEESNSISFIPELKPKKKMLRV